MGAIIHHVVDPHYGYSFRLGLDLPSPLRDARFEAWRLPAVELMTRGFATADVAACAEVHRR
jgi:hypothetical protein